MGYCRIKLFCFLSKKKKQNTFLSNIIFSPINKTVAFRSVVVVGSGVFEKQKQTKLAVRADRANKAIRLRG